MSAPCRPSGRPEFLTLPPEIRSNIYAELVAAHRNRHPKNPNPRGSGGDIYEEYSFHLNVFQVSKKVYAEAYEVFRRENVFIVIESPWTRAELQLVVDAQVPLVTRGTYAANFYPYHMAASIELPDMQYSKDLTSRFVICKDDLEAFCQLWYYNEISTPNLNDHLRFTLALSNPSPVKDGYQTSNVSLPKSLQKELLAPFTRIKSLPQIKLSGDIYEDIEADFRRKLALPADTPETCLERCTRLKDSGNSQFAMSEYTKAIKLYEQAFTAMHIPTHGRYRKVWGDLFYDKTLQGGRYDQESGIRMRLMLRVKLVSNVMQAYLKLGKFLEVHFWGTRSVDTLRDSIGEIPQSPPDGFPAPKEWGRICYRLGLAYEKLGNEPKAREYVRLAANWLPEDDVVQRKKVELAPKLL